MDITPLIPKDKKIITGYGDGCFKINNQPHQGSVIINSNEVLSWNIEGSSSLNLESLSGILESELDMELLIIGCGTEHIKMPGAISSAFRAKNINVEIMTTGAACRTYNVLLSEGRDIGVALIAV